MAVRMVDALKNAMLDAYEAHYSTAPLLKLYTGSVAGSVGTAPAGTLLATLTLPSDWMNAASGGSKTLLGSWTVNASAAGTIGCWTLSTSGSVIKEDGTASLSGGGGDLIVDNLVTAVGQPVTITAWTLGL